MSYTVEDNYQKLKELIDLYPKELHNMIDKGDLESFKKYIEFYNPISKDLIGAYIFYQYCRGKSVFILAEIANYVLEALEVLDIQEEISLIEKIHNLYTTRGYLYDTSRIQIRLHIKTMTIEDVLEEEKEQQDKFKKYIDQYLNFLESKDCFEQLYGEIMAYYYNAGIEKQEATRKIKALHCANHLHNMTKEK